MRFKGTGWKIVVVIAAVTGLAGSFHAQQQPPNVKGRMEGTVLRENTAEPISGAKIQVIRVNGATGASLPTAGTLTTYLINPGAANTPLPQANPVNPPGAAGPPAVQPPPIPSVVTDGSGRFVVPDLDEGAYRVSITLNGYVKQEYGQRGFVGQGTMLMLTRGEVMKDMVVRMTRAGNVYGRITDESGQPASGVPIQLVKATYNQNGLRTFQTGGTARTNDRGEYRLYWLTPGRYYLVAGTPSGPPNGSAPGGNPSPNESGDTYVYTYYPGTTDLSQATSVEVKAGSEMAMDMLVPKAHLFKISGKISLPPNTADPTAFGISLGFQMLTGGSGFIQMTSVVDPVNRTFEMINIVPGSYALQANGGTVTARVPIEVTNADVANVVLELSGGVNIAGKARLDSGGALPTAPVRIQLRPMVNGSSNFVGFAPGAQANATDGTFRFERALVGEYRAVVAPVAGHYLKELLFDHVDVMNSPIALRPSSTEPLIEIVLSLGVAQVEGIASDEKNQPLPGVQAVLIPDKNRDRPELFKAVTTDQAGHFVMKDIAPGDYKLFSWEVLDNFGYFDQDMLRQFDSQGKPVHVTESAKLKVEVKVIPEPSR